MIWCKLPSGGCSSILRAAWKKFRWWRIKFTRRRERKETSRKGNPPTNFKRRRHSRSHYYIYFIYGLETHIYIDLCVDIITPDEVSRDLTAHRRHITLQICNHIFEIIIFTSSLVNDYFVIIITSWLCNIHSSSFLTRLEHKVYPNAGRSREHNNLREKSSYWCQSSCEEIHWIYCTFIPVLFLRLTSYWIADLRHQYSDS